MKIYGTVVYFAKRKPHVCELCYGEIAKGKRYIRVVQAQDDAISVCALHPLCYDLLYDFRQRHKREYNFTWEHVTKFIRKKYCSRCGERKNCQYDTFHECGKIRGIYGRD